MSGRNPILRVAIVLSLLTFAINSYADSVVRYAPSKKSKAFLEYQAGMEALSRHQIQDAQAAFQRSLASNPKYAPAFVGLAEIASEQHNPAVAEQQLKKALGCDQSYPVSHRAMGRLLYTQKRYPEAIAELQKAADLAKDWALPYVDLGDIYMLLKRPADAARNYRSALAIDNSLSGAHYALGVALAESGDVNGAMQSLQRATVGAPSNPLPWEAIGNLHSRQKQYAEAIQAYDKAAGIAPNDYVPHLLKAQALAASGKRTEAQLEYGVAGKLAPAAVRPQIAKASQAR